MSSTDSAVAATASSDSDKGNNSNNEQVESMKILKMRELDAIPPPSEWKKRPFFFCVNTAAMGNDMKLLNDKYNDINGELPVGVPIEYETSFFKGCCLLRVKGVEPDDDCTNKDEYHEYFKGRNRKWQIVMQGQFKQELFVADLVQGSEFVRPYVNMLPKMIMQAAENILHAFSPHGSLTSLASDTPCVMSCIGSMSRIIRADKPGTEPDICDLNLQDDCTAFGGIFAQKDATKSSVSISKRKKALCNRDNQFKFDTNHVYTLEYYDHLLNVSTSEADLYGLAKVKLASHYDGQPINATIKLLDGRYLCSFQLWHESIVKYKKEYDEKAAAKKLGKNKK